MKATEEKPTMTVSQAIAEGYTKYLYAGSGFQSLQLISDLEINGDEDRSDLELVNKDGYHPAGISPEDLAELVIEHIEDNHISESGDDTGEISAHLKSDVDFEPLANHINEVLSGLTYYKSAGIKLIKDHQATS